MTAFDDSFRELVGEEGVFSTDRTDPGNWTGGNVGVGEFKGSKYGVSAASYPLLDIAALTLDGAKAIAKQDFWDRVRGDDLPPPVAHALFDCAYNQGVGSAIRLFQHALGVAEDGAFGSQTLNAFWHSDAHKFAHDFTVARIVRYSMAHNWAHNANGWVGRALHAYAEMLR